MSKIEWPSKKDQLEAIGYLACPGVVARIEAMVPENRLDKFKKKYEGKYTSEYPYIVKEGSKFGDQLRLYLNDNDGCPSVLREHLDATYGVRINDTSFISFLVMTFGFVITNGPQDCEKIKEQAKFLEPEEYEWFLKGYYGHEEFITTLKREILYKELPKPDIEQIPQAKLPKTKKKAPKNRVTLTSSYTPEQLQNIGWIGEQYIYLLLKRREESLLEELGINDKKYRTIWFNEGFYTSEKWFDKSVGEGCDIVIETDELPIFIEVKTSKKQSDIFTMTNNEMVTMEEQGERYFVIKINWIENLLRGESPQIWIYKKPFELLFKPRQIKEAVFYVKEC